MNFYYYDILLISGVPYISRECVLAPNFRSRTWATWPGCRLPVSDTAPPPRACGHLHPLPSTHPYAPSILEDRDWRLWPQLLTFLCGVWTCDDEFSAAGSSWEAICGERGRGRRKMWWGATSSHLMSPSSSNFWSDPGRSQLDEAAEPTLLQPACHRVGAAVPSPSLAFNSRPPGAEAGLWLVEWGWVSWPAQLFKKKKKKVKSQSPWVGGKEN